MAELLPVFADHTYCRIEDLLNKALDCPRCYAHKSQLIVMSEKVIIKPRYLINCTQCNYHGPFGKHIKDALYHWNKSPSNISKLLCAWKMKRQSKKILINN